MDADAHSTQHMNLSLGRVVEPLVGQMETKLRRRQITGSATCAKKTAEVMRMVQITQSNTDVLLHVWGISAWI